MSAREIERRSIAIASRAMVILGLSSDHRAIAGALAARFLASGRKRVDDDEA